MFVSCLTNDYGHVLFHTCPGLVDLCLILSPRLSHLHSKNNTCVYVKLICIQLVIYSTMMAAKFISWFLVCDCLVILVEWMMGSILCWIRAEKKITFLSIFCFSLFVIFTAHWKGDLEMGLFMPLCLLDLS